MELDLVRFNLRAHIDQVVRTLAVEAHEKGLELLCEWKTGVPGHIIGDQVRLRQVIVNLLGNAIKFTGREVALEVGVEESTRTKSSSISSFEIRASGSPPTSRS